MSGRKVYGAFVVRSDEDDEYEHRVECHYPEGSSMWQKVEDGLYAKVDFERFSVEWEPAPFPKADAS